MKYIAAAAVLAIVSGSVHANGYVGLSFGRGKLPIDCSSGADACKDRVNVFKLYAGTRLSPSSQMDLGVAKLDGVEVAYMRAKESRFSTSNPGQIVALVENEFGDLENQVVNVNMPFKRKLSFDSLVIAPVLTAALPVPGLRVFAKPGVAVVTSTVDAEWNGRSQRSDSSTRVKPYASVGVEYEVLKGVSLQGAFDWMRYAVGDQSGTHRSMTVGAQVAF